jgi:hypothetical protein
MLGVGLFFHMILKQRINLCSRSVSFLHELEIENKFVLGVVLVST